MNIYIIGVLISFGRIMVQEEDKPDTFPRACLLLLCSAIWPLLLGLEIEQRIRSKEKDVK